MSCAYIGHCKANGAGRWEVKEDGWSDAGIEEHQDAVAAMMARFPDQPRRRKPKEQADGR